MGALAQFMVHQDRQETVPVTVVPTNNLPIKIIYEKQGRKHNLKTIDLKETLNNTFL